MGKGGDAATTTASSSHNFSHHHAPPAPAAPHHEKITWQQVKEHNQPEDAWLVYHNKVYDVSNWHEHPGGAVIFTHAGDDMTDIFAAFHAAGSQSLMKRFYIGDLDVSTTPKDAQQVAFEKGYRDLRAKLVLMGMFKTNGWFYVYKCCSNMCIWAAAVALVYMFPHNTACHVLSALALGIFFQQSGWLAHDFLHHQVFSNRRHGDYLGLFWGNVMQGYSVQWWKNKHNGHHAVPNLHNSTVHTQDGDPDIDTMPILAWSVEQAKQYRELQADGQDSGVVKFMIRHQAAFYFPVLLLARLSWLHESFKTAFGLGASSENAKLELQRKGLQYPVLEKLGLILHFCWMLAVSTGFGHFSSVAYSAAYFLLATSSCGFLLAIVFGLGHNGMATYNAHERPDFWKLQVTTTRNIIGGHGIPQAFVDWFCGGLQYQVDHHLFPTLPRHNLAKCHVLIHSFCQEWKVQYHEADLVDGTMEVLWHLRHVSDQFLREFVTDGPTM